MTDKDSIQWPRGFRTAAVACGIKPSGNSDLLVLTSDEPAEAFGMFTTNKFVAAPVVYSKRIIDSYIPIKAVVVNAGNANAGTGPQGEEDVLNMAAAVAKGLRCSDVEVLVASTGVIARKLPMENIMNGISDVTSALEKKEHCTVIEAAEAIMTTDTISKSATRCFDGVTLTGIAKGVGMIHPGMATLLGFITTDAVLNREQAESMLRPIVDRTFNAISVDNDMSTNDMIILLANGASGKTSDNLEHELESLCLELALSCVRDGEGATKLVTVTVKGCASDKDARDACEAISTSYLVKSALHGEDPNWGRILAAVGRSGAEFSPDDVIVKLQGHILLENGNPVLEDLTEVNKAMKSSEISIEVDLNAGDFAWKVYTSDLSEEYVTINADYTT
ncbi:MAG: bifunctional glutamate N-acetyltransferase/amino-acid acetyltransferase ArgJ [Candidatus Lindowbacteria bacterium]|nr:bifunctional glutamate N-acetyltransferase/amino-acid acetyltransferase ArgJ [Candidatus Lindowbacteria bacterium]